MRTFIFWIFGLDSYIKELQIASERSATDTMRKQKTINELQHTLAELRETNKKLYQYNNELKDDATRTASVIEEKEKEINRINELCNQYNAQCARFGAKINSQNGRIGNLTRQLNRLKNGETENYQSTY